MNNAEFRLGEIELLPVRNEKADIIITTCVINLSPDKLGVDKEALRVLKPGGRLYFSDIVALVELPEEIRQDLSLISTCGGGAADSDSKQFLSFSCIKIQTVKMDSAAESHALFQMS